MVNGDRSNEGREDILNIFGVDWGGLIGVVCGLLRWNRGWNVDGG